MSWPQWPTGTQPSVLNPAPAVPVPPAGLQYTSDQWAQLQQQNWNQWAQWQQQYQQWHQQYGAEYQKSMNALNAQLGQQQTVGTLPNVAVPPPLPLPQESNKPPLPLDEPPPNVQYSTSLQPPQSYPNPPPSTPIQQPPRNQQNWQQNQRYDNQYQKRQYDQAEDSRNNAKRPNKNAWQQIQQPPTVNIVSPQANKQNVEELSEAEKKFDKQFADWEAQFNRWKEQNVGHPDKQQYREYEKRWETWRAQLLERREQMKRKRLGLQSDSPNLKTVQQSFNTPPQFNIKPPQSKGLLPTRIMNKPPPNLNDEPLAFKPKRYSEIPPVNTTAILEDDSGSDFLKTAPSGGIPGLDLVKDDDKQPDKNVIEFDRSPGKKVADFDAISKGINNILGDQKLMNMLSMVSHGQTQNTDSSPVNSVSKIQSNETIINEQTEQSYEDYSNLSENYHQPHHQREFVNNFDDLTRSSFTAGQNDQWNDGRNQPNFADNNQFGNRFGGFNKKNRFEHDDFNRFGANNDRQPPSNRRPFQAPQENRQFSGGESKQDAYNEPEEYYDDYNDQYREGNDEQHFKFGLGQNYDDYYDVGDGEDDGGREHSHGGYDDADQYESGNQDDWIEPEVKAVVEKLPEKEEELLRPATVIDYEHKSMKSDEPEVLIEPIRMFDYRHKPLSRLPLPQRPKWLSEAVRHIRDFDPPQVRSFETNLRRYPPDNWRDERLPPTPAPYQERWPPRVYENNRPLFDRSRSYESRPYDDSRKNDTTNNRGSLVATKNHLDDNFDDFDEDIEDVSAGEDDWKTDHEAEVQFANPPATKVVLVEDLINPPGLYNRPPRIVIILRGPPGSGKTYLAKLIKDKEVENGGSAPRILSLDDYFLVEQEKEISEEGKTVKIKEMVYEYEEGMEESYRLSLVKSFKKTITDGYFSFIIVDNVNDKVKYFGEMWSFAKQNGFQVYICQLDLDVQTCTKRNIHGRSESDIERCVGGWEPTPAHHPILDATSLLQSASIAEVEMEEVNSPEALIADLDGDDDDDDGSEEDQVVTRSKWDNFDLSVNNLAKLDGVNKPLRPSRTMEEYLQMDEQWAPPKSTKPGQKRVRWADLEEQKQQEKMRAIGFVVGHTNWDRMMDPTKGGSALTQTKYIERTGRH